MIKARRNQINARVDNETNEALKRMAAAVDSSVGSLCAQIIIEYIAKRQTSGGSGVFDEISQQFDERLAEHDRRLMRDIEAAIKPARRELMVLKAQADMLVELIAPERRNEYQQGVAKLIQTLGSYANGGTR
jgi:hypothetical protein